VNRAGTKLFRAFPWDRDAPEGERFSASWISETQGQGRFDLPSKPGGVLYLAETPEHAVAEMIQHYRGQELEEADLGIAGHPLALVTVGVSARIAGRVVDLCDPEVLLQLGIRPDQTASRERRGTQRIAALIHAGGHTGLRWWSALPGDWHTALLFCDRINDDLTFGAPEPLSFTHPALNEAMRVLGISGRSHRSRGAH
jgi:hypothetical protein